MSVLNFLPNAVGQRAPTQVFGQISDVYPAPIDFTDPIWVTIPDWNTTIAFQIQTWPALYGQTLPFAGAECLLEYDNQGNVRCVWWSGTPDMGSYPTVKSEAQANDNELFYDTNTGNLAYTDSSGNVTQITSSSAFSETFVYDQGSPATVWTINHNMGKYPSVFVEDSAGDNVEGVVAFVDDNNLTITFNAAFSGTAYLN